MLDTRTCRPSWVLFCLALAVFAVAAVPVSAEEVLYEGSWTGKTNTISGTWRIVDDGGKKFVVLDDAFKTRKAPDLKLFLTPLGLADVDNHNATRDSALIAQLPEHKGQQKIAIPVSVDLARYKTLIIHCEKYSKLWGGATLTPKS